MLYDFVFYYPRAICRSKSIKQITDWEINNNNLWYSITLPDTYIFVEVYDDVGSGSISFRSAGVGTGASPGYILIIAV